MEDEKSHQEPSTSKDTKCDQSDEDGDENQGFETDTSSGDSETTEKCPICLLKFGNDQEIGKPATCDHAFCFPCIEEWSKVVRTCPIDRKEFAQIKVYDNLDDNNLLRTVAIGEQISIKDYTATEEFTSCEVCGSIEREDVMLLCDGCDKGFHMDCLDPPMQYIPIENWYCSECESMESSEEEETDVEELNDLQEEIKTEFGDLPATRLRNQPQPQILRTLQSERIRNAILARRSRATINTQPSTSQHVTATKRKPAKKRKTRKKRSTVVEYEVRDCGGKFPIKRTKKRAVRKKRKKKRVTKRATTRKSSTSTAHSFCANPNVFELQHARHRAGVSNFNIFEPTNQLDYIPDEEENIENEPYFAPIAGSDDGVLIQSAINHINPIRRQAMIKKRVINNFTTTSTSCDLIDSILNEKNFFGKPSIKNSEGIKMTKASDGNSSTSAPKEAKGNENESEGSRSLQSTEILPPSNSSNAERNEADEQRSVTESLTQPEKSPPKKKKKVFDMFDENTPERVDEASEREECPNFSIYNMESADEHENIQLSQSHSENFDDLVQMSDEGEQQVGTDVVLEENEPVVIFKSQPASPDLENNEEERSYTPPIVKVDSQKEEKKSSSSRKSKKHSRRQELERYNVRERFREEKTPIRSRDRFGRNRTRSRSNSRNRRKSRSPDRKTRQKSRSNSRRRDSSDERRRKKIKRKKSERKSRSPSASPQRRRNYRDDKSPRRHRKRSTSPIEKSKKKKFRPRSREKSFEASTKEVYTSGQNILVSVNFSSQEKRSSHDDKEPIVDITAKKKINVSSKPVAIIDLARSPFRELTPEYKKESNVIELSDSEGEKHAKLPKSPDSTKLYDPFDILNSPPNENVTSSQQNSLKSSKVTEHRDSIAKSNVQPTAVPKTFPHHTTEENLVTSSSNAFEKIFPTRVANKIDVIQSDVIQIPNKGMTIESPYSPGANDDAYHDATNDYNEDENESVSHAKSNVGSKQTEKVSANLFDELFGSSSPPGLDRIKGGKKSDPTNKYINKLKRQERVIEEVKGAIKPHYSRRSITKEQYKEIMRKAVPKICHNKSGEINPTKIKHLIDSYVKFYSHLNKKKRPEMDETF